MNVIFQAMDVLLDLSASTSDQSGNDTRPDYSGYNPADMRFLIDHNDSVSGNIELFLGIILTS